jgi:hypothetical protein
LSVLGAPILCFSPRKSAEDRHSRDAAYVLDSAMALAFNLGEFRSHREGIAYPTRPETNNTDALRAKFPSKRAGQPLYRCAGDAKAARERDSHPRR